MMRSLISHVNKKFQSMFFVLKPSSETWNLHNIQRCLLAENIFISFQNDRSVWNVEFFKREIEVNKKASEANTN